MEERQPVKMFSKRLGISEDDIAAQLDKSVLLEWSLELQRDVNGLKGKISQEKDDRYNKISNTDQSTFRKWETALRALTFLKQKIDLKLTSVNKSRSKTFEQTFVDIAQRTLREDLFEEIRTQALEEVEL